MSANSATLYFSNESILYKLSLATGAATGIGTASAGVFGAEEMSGKTLYAGSVSPLAIYSLNRKTGQSTFVSTLSGTGVANPWGLIPIKATHIKQSDICKVHKIP